MGSDFVAKRLELHVEGCLNTDVHGMVHSHMHKYGWTKAETGSFSSPPSCSPRIHVQEMCNRLNADIHRIKLQKVALQKTMEGSAKQFAQWRAEREKTRDGLVPVVLLRVHTHIHKNTHACIHTGAAAAAQAEPTQHSPDPVPGGNAGQAKRSAAAQDCRCSGCTEEVEGAAAQDRRCSGCAEEVEGAAGGQECVAVFRCAEFGCCNVRP
eukprot:scaffold74977_cov19-Tisochrysis_lutea.AAC.2